jgi:DNA-binding MarR family transcriptional regulator
MPETTSTDNIIYSRLLLGEARHLLVRARKKELAPYHVLTIINDLGNKANFTKLAKLTNRKQNTLSIQMKRMENDGLVKKGRERPKSRELVFELTEKGKIICDAAKKIESITTIMSILSKAERQQLISALEKIISKAEQYLD